MTTLADLRQPETEETIRQKLFDILQVLGVDAESWESGDPTRSLLDSTSRLLSTFEPANVAAINSGFRELATGPGLTIWARQMYNVERIPATYAVCVVRITNAGGALIEIEPDDLTFLSSATQKTYRNTTGGTLLGGGTLDVTVAAEESGSDSNALPGEIDSLVDSIPRVSVTNTTTAIGTNEERDADLQSRSLASLGALSSNGPSDAYNFVTRTPKLVNGRVITRARVIDDSTVGEVEIYIAGPSGAVDAPTVADVDAGIETWCNPLCNSHTVASATNAAINITYQLWVYAGINKTGADIETAIEKALADALTTRPVGGDITPPSAVGYLYRGFLEATILQAVAPFGYRVLVTTPITDTALAANQVATLGTVTHAINVVEGP